MATATVAPPVQSETTERILLQGIRWSTYEALLEDIGDRQIRLTYDDGSLEIMTLSARHERSKKLLARMVEAMTEELNIPIRIGGSTTMKRQSKQKGLEPDECYWVANELLVRGRDDLDLEVDPPPDIAVEVEVSRSALDGMRIYAALRVPEIWRSDGETVIVNQLQEDGSYAIVPQSPSFSWLPVAELSRFLAASKTMDEARFIRLFRAWVRKHVAPLAPDFGERAE
jgi:Uma2 family endonuclease